MKFVEVSILPEKNLPLCRALSDWSYIGVYVHHSVVVAHTWHRFDSVDEGGSLAKEQVQDVRPSGGELDQL